MSTTDFLTATIKPQHQTETVSDDFPDVLMDDTAYTMDDAGAYMGGPTVNSAEVPLSVSIHKAPQSSIKHPNF